MPKPVDFVGEISGMGGEVYRYKNDTEAPVQCEYACVTAPKVIRCEVAIDRKIVDIVYAGNGGSHSWWTPAGGRLLCRTLQPGETLTVSLSGRGAFRIDWYP
jgi:hypothetical protein